jgi:mRNA-degrading endonuclease toxin of MazEF toxin-antitoxin module
LEERDKQKRNERERKRPSERNKEIHKEMQNQKGNKMLEIIRMPSKPNEGKRYGTIADDDMPYVSEKSLDRH